MVTLLKGITIISIGSYKLCDAFPLLYYFDYSINILQKKAWRWRWSLYRKFIFLRVYEP